MILIVLENSENWLLLFGEKVKVERVDSPTHLNPREQESYFSKLSGTHFSKMSQPSNLGDNIYYAYFESSMELVVVIGF